MIDTVCLLIPKNKMMFAPNGSKWDLCSKTEQYEKFIRNPNKAEKETGKYFPRLTGYKRHFFQDENVRIEFSVPKLLYSNNLEELEQKDFDKVIKVLQERLVDMGIIFSKDALENASVSSVHFSKNILLKDGHTSNYLISEMNKVNLQKRFDFTKTRFINDGQSLYAHASSHEFVIYDKVADLNKDKKRSIDKDQSFYQRSLFSELDKKEEKQEIIRFEVRLNKKQKMNNVLEGLGCKKNPLFKDVFSVEISKSVVNDYWQKLIKDRSFGVFSMSMSIKDVLQNIFIRDKKIKPKEAIYLLGLFMLGKDETGMRQLRTILSCRSHDRTWYRLVQGMKKVNGLVTENNYRDWVTQIDTMLEDYKPYKLK